MRYLAALVLMASSPALAVPSGTASTGRFQIIQEQHADRAPERFMLDTQTGKIWRQSCLNGVADDCDLSAWMVEVVEGVTMPLAEISAMSEKQFAAAGNAGNSPTAAKKYIRRRIIPTNQ